MSVVESCRFFYLGVNFFCYCICMVIFVVNSNNDVNYCYVVYIIKILYKLIVLF